MLAEQRVDDLKLKSIRNSISRTCLLRILAAALRAIWVTEPPHPSSTPSPPPPPGCVSLACATSAQASSPQSQLPLPLKRSRPLTQHLCHPLLYLFDRSPSTGSKKVRVLGLAAFAHTRLALLLHLSP